ncbi:ABC transporter [Paenibacillus radicis (ex Gao et al. 2016)]|uniref:ABC transporter n=1 Tax=Paenibacillus radicis (ex Gao et al. 2016) TaxID=1737354 RepID=A0A917GS69_9BACL|nr:ABC transporter [Paenibacillus radicis (ex Gao et al. 2016)]
MKRYREIGLALLRNGFGYIAKDLGLPDRIVARGDQDTHEMRRRSVGERLRSFLEELGPTFVKLGQLASTRADLIPASLIGELERLQDQVPPFAYEEAVSIIEQELGAPLGVLYASFHKTPLASASIGQVYQAVLIDGTAVAVKVQRPNITKQIETDLDILIELAKMAEHRLEWARQYQIRDMVEELAKAIRTELDYEKEARNAERFASYASKYNGLRIPAVYGQLSSKKVLTMEFLEGIKLSDKESLQEAGHHARSIAERYAEAILHQVLSDGLFHGDPHPGNVLVMASGDLAFLDFGMVGRLGSQRKRQFGALVIALRNQSTNGVIRAISAMGFIPDQADMELLRTDVDELRDKYYKVPLSQLSLGESVNDLFLLARRHQIRLPAELTLLGKTFLTMEGVVTMLDPDFSVFDVAEPIGRQLFLEQFNIRVLAGQWLEEIPEYAAIAADVPAGVRKLLTALRRGKFGLEITVPELGEFLRKMDQISNRLSLSIVLLSFSIIMVGLIIGSSLRHQDNVLWNIPAIEIGFGVASLLFVWIIYSIYRSGRF